MYFEYNGKILTIPEWSKVLNIPVKTLYSRVKKGITDPSEIFKKRGPSDKKQSRPSGKKYGHGRGHVLFPGDVKYTNNGESLTIAEWAKKLGCTEVGLRWRLRHWPLNIALSRYRRGGLRDGDIEVDDEQIDFEISAVLDKALDALETVPEHTEEKPHTEQPSTDHASPVQVPIQVPAGINPELVAAMLAAAVPDTPTAPEPKRSKRKRPNPIYVSPAAVEKMYERLGRKHAIFVNTTTKQDRDKAVKECIRHHFINSVEVEMPRCGAAVDYASPTVKYYRHNNWILCVEGLHIKMIQYGDAKRWKVKKPS